MIPFYITVHEKMALPCSTRKILSEAEVWMLWCCCLQLGTTKKEEVECKKASFLSPLPGSCKHHFHSHPTGQTILTRPIPCGKTGGKTQFLARGPHAQIKIMLSSINKRRGDWQMTITFLSKDSYFPGLNDSQHAAV